MNEQERMQDRKPNLALVAIRMVIQADVNEFSDLKKKMELG